EKLRRHGFTGVFHAVFATSLFVQSLEVAHLHGEFVIGPATEASTLPLVAIARNYPLHTTGP
ncbi:hypothetical protein, partial [Pseudomonas sp. SM4]|uniref:hypothetical protein n=1 Tax=Pseudomonas sp. SM4 TaxID=3424177 RepID=UPI003F7B2861